MPVQVRGEPVADTVADRHAVRLAGSIAVILLLVLLAAAVGSLAAGLRGRRARLVRTGLWLSCAAAGTAVAAVGLLLATLLTGDTGLLYVVQNWSPDLSLPYRVAALWAGAQGSLLFWCFLLLAATAGIAAAALRGRSAAPAAHSASGDAAADEAAALRAGAVLVMAGVALFVAALLVFDGGSDPFAAAPAAAVPAGLNPLLLHPAMALHPPALFLGYVGLTVPFAYCVAALAGGRLGTAWVRAARGWALAGWTFLSLGIGLGAWWAYVILSWGGYWGWDPVENSSLVPWLTATALLHSLSRYRQAAAFRRWAAVLAPLTFWLTILAVWTTRSGVVASVHAFAQRSLLVAVLSALLAAVAAVSIALLTVRWKALGSDGSSLPLGVRGTLHVLLDVTLTALAGALVFATVVAPLGLRQTVRSETYEMLARPLGMLVVLGVGVCALLGRPPRGRRRTLDRVAVPFAAAVTAAVVLGATGWASDPLGLAGLSICAFSGVAVLQSLWWRPAAGGRAARLVATVRRAPWGAVLVHVGVAVLVAGLVGAGMYDTRVRLDLPAEEGAVGSLGDVRLTIAGLDVTPAPQGGERVAIRFAVERDGRPSGTVSPALDYYQDSGLTVPRAAVAGAAWQDLFVSPVSFGTDGIVVDVIVFPLVRAIWAGAALLVAGGVVALWPRRRTSTGGPTEARVDAQATVPGAEDRGSG